MQGINRGHLVVALGVVVGAIAATTWLHVSVQTIALVALVLACPLMMWMMMGSHDDHSDTNVDDERSATPPRR